MSALLNEILISVKHFNALSGSNDSNDLIGLTDAGSIPISGLSKMEWRVGKPALQSAMKGLAS
jgi:hypothetical protein